MAFLTESSKVAYGDLGELGSGEQAGELEALVRGTTQTSQSTLLLKKRKEQREVDSSLEFMKAEFQCRMEACDERQREFERKQAEMREQVKKFEKFVSENDAKRNRAENKARSESKQRQQQEQKLNSLNEKLLQMQDERSRLDKALRNVEIYQQYLESAVECTEGEYEEIPDLLNRYHTLANANIDLRRLVSEGESQMDKVRGQLNQLRRETQNALLVHNSSIHANQKDLETIRENSMKADSDRELGEKILKDRFRESGQVIMSIKNLYLRSIASSKAVRPSVAKAKSKDQSRQLAEYLKLIQFRITDLQTVCDNFKSGSGLVLDE